MFKNSNTPYSTLRIQPSSLEPERVLQGSVVFRCVPLTEREIEGRSEDRGEERRGERDRGEERIGERDRGEERRGEERGIEGRRGEERREG